jgi:hypothetical protein
MSAVETRVEKTLNSQKRGVTTTTLEKVGATSVMEISIPGADAKVRNVRRSLADGRAILQYDIVDSTVGDTYSVSGTASQEPLAIHPYFQTNGKWAVTDDEWKKWDKWQKEGTDISAEDLSSFGEGFRKFIKLYLSGFSDYLQPRVSLRVTDANADEPDLSELGKIAAPRNAPDLADGADWLMSGCDASVDSDGNWEVTREFISSGPGGWNPDIYGEGT